MLTSNFDSDGELHSRIMRADKLYGPFASVHEAIGVCSEEWDELRAAMHDNDLKRVKAEALDLAAALIRLHDGLVAGSSMASRSGM